mmetsp:Transcript_33353/g.88248  ORF Transcript_33353/g.88248 Transcript_33353/m.88248 type:complete len:203 (+) Transcript_33353:206-814(+)|eukprot:CAMPEP_0119512168 /NCGR_PEP_ID=MMETSP1344-20130328/30610_1 /TAXON_ID=236787 /ORGANISM="Florenciella parvula, Strain CCMP2471" /LENGTH=202 /DNA_ID=CAMNT_0007549257 /DNA_START=159 /DNA_END=767 /DNA_ORIENTATION=-
MHQHNIDQLTIVGSILAGVIGTEIITYYMIYRTEKFQDLRDLVLRTSKLVNSKKAAEERRKAEEKAALRGKEGKKGKLGKMSSMEVQLKTRTKELFQMKFHSNLITAGILMVLYWGVTSSYTGTPVAVLPFEPLTMMRPLTHRGLTGDDFTQCSVALFYAMSSLAIKESVTRFMGLGIPPGIQSPMSDAVKDLEKYQEQFAN